MKENNNSFILSEHGDILERTEYEFINSKLGGYEIIWKQLVGHDGKGKMPQLQLPEDASKTRVKFAESMYTCLESAVCMKYIVEEIKDLQVTGYKEYLKFLNSLICFQAHAGRIRDNIKKLTASMISSGREQEECNILLEKCYQERNNILHGTKIPFALLEKSVLIPLPQGKDIDTKRWSTDKTWDDIEIEDYKFLEIYLQESFDDILSNLNRSLFKILPHVYSFVEENDIKLVAPDTPYQTLFPSGSAESLSIDCSDLWTDDISPSGMSYPINESNLTFGKSIFSSGCGKP